MSAAGTDSRALADQQLTKNGVPIIVDSCVAFVTQYGEPTDATEKAGAAPPPRRPCVNSPPVLPRPGLCQEGVYQRQGDPERAAQLLEEFTRDARNVKLREKEHRLEDVTDTLKNFLSQAEEALLAKELYPFWVSALGTKQKHFVFFFSLQS